MPALNFKAQFADLVASGEKRCTIRALRKRPIRFGDTLHLFTGMRTAQCRRLRTATCTKVSPIAIMFDPATEIQVQVGPEILSWRKVKRLATRDGFETTAAFGDFFFDTHGLPFEGQLIEWEPADA